MDTASNVRGAEKVMEEQKKTLKMEVSETTHDCIFSIKYLRCVVSVV